MGDGQTIDPHKLDLVGRLGGGWYVRASGEALFEVPRPIGKRPIGLQGLPGFIRDSHLYSGNDLGRFGLRESIPTESEVSAFFESHATEMPFSEVQFNQAEKEANLTDMFAQAMDMVNRKHPDRVHYLERTAKAALALGEIEFAWHAAMLAGRQQRAQVG